MLGQLDGQYAGQTLCFSTVYTFMEPEYIDSLQSEGVVDFVDARWSDVRGK
jgi:hypothetical protein